MQIISKLLVCAILFAAVANADEDTFRKGCESADDAETPAVTPAPSPTTPMTSAPEPATPTITTPASPTAAPTSTPATSTPATLSPESTTSAPTTSTPTTSSPVTTTAPPETTTPVTPPVATTPAPTETTAAPAPSVDKTDKTAIYEIGDPKCAGFVRVFPPSGTPDRTGCALDFQVKFTKTLSGAGCVVCTKEFVYDNTTALALQPVPLCGDLPLCTRFYRYDDVTEADVLCMLNQNGGSPIEDPKVCNFIDN